MEKTKLLRYGGLVAGAILIAFGLGALGMSVNGALTVRSNLKDEQIRFPDAAKDSAAPKKYSLQIVDSGTKARAFAEMMRTHTLNATGGYTYSQVGKYVARTDAPKDEIELGGGTNSAAYAVMDPKTNQPKENSNRNLWVTATALTTALNTAYMAENLALFGLVVGVALLLAGIGFIILAWYALGALRREPVQTASPAAAVTPITDH